MRGLFDSFVWAREQSYVSDSDKGPIMLMRSELECLTVTRDYNVITDVVVRQDRVFDGYERARRRRHAR